MKLTKSKLKQIIREELKINLNEDEPNIVDLVQQINTLTNTLAELKPTLKTAVKEFMGKLNKETVDEIVSSILEPTEK